MSKVGWKNSTLFSKGGGSKTGNNIDFKDLFLRVTPDKTEGSEVTNTVRFLEQPTPYFIHWPNKRDTESNSLVRCEFPDADSVRRPTRVCFAKIDDDGVKDDPNCPWCNMGYSRQLRFMVNVISREHGKAMVLDCNKTIIEAVSAWVEQAELDELDNTNPSSWDEEAPEFRIKAVRVKGGSIDWSITPSTKLKKISDADKDCIRELNPDASSDEEALQVFPVKNLTKPTPLGDGHTADADDDDDDDDPLGEEEPRKEKKVARKRVEDTSDDDSNPYSDSDKAVEEDEEELSPAAVGSDDDDDDDDFGDWV